MNNERKTKKIKRRLPGAGGASILPTLQNTKTKPQIPLLPCALLSVRIATLKLPPPLRTFHIFSTIGKKNNSQRIQRSKCVSATQGLGFAEVFGVRTMRNLSSHAGGVRKRNLEVFYLLLGSGGGGGKRYEK
jgi:hypothetical protein